MAKQLILENVSVHYGDLAAVRGVSLQLEEGEIGCLLGPSGCGKTTLLRAIAGFEPVSDGRILLHGTVISEPARQLPPEQRRVGMVFQDFALFPHLNTMRNIAFGLAGLNRQQRDNRVKELLELVDLERHALSMPHELSGGQQQRVALARALAPEPDILLLDEPFSNLDSELREQLAREVRTLLVENGVTAILVTHDQHEAFTMTDSVTLLREGEVAQSDSPYNLYHNPANEFVAGFIGQGARIAITVGASGINEQLALPARISSQWRPGDELELLIRPDDVEFAADSSTGLAITGKVFRGAQYLYELALADGQQVICLTPSHVDFEIGDTLPVRFNLQHVVIFRR